MLVDFKVADEVLTTESAFFNVFDSYNEITVFDNSTLSKYFNYTTNSSFVGNYYQNAYRHYQLHVKSGERTFMNFTSNIEIHAKGVYFSFYQTTDSDTFVNSVVASIDNDTLIHLNKFRYIGIEEDKESSQIGKMRYLQTFSFSFSENATEEIDHKINYVTFFYEGEILMDNIALYY